MIFKETAAYVYYPSVRELDEKIDVKKIRLAAGPVEK